MFVNVTTAIEFSGADGRRDACCPSRCAIVAAVPLHFVEVHLHALQVREQIACGLVAHVRVLLERLADDRVHLDGGMP